MKKSNKDYFVGIVLGVCIGVVLNAYLIWDASYYGVLNKHSPLDFIWRLYVYVGETPMYIALIFAGTQIGITILYCVLFSALVMSKRKIVPPSFVIMGSTVPLLLITGSIYFQYFHSYTEVSDPMNSTYFIMFFITFLYTLSMYSFTPHFDRIVKKILGAHAYTEQIEKKVQSYSSDLDFASLIELMSDKKWLTEYASLHVTDAHIGKQKKEAFFRLKKLGTNYYLCTSIFQSSRQNLTLLIFYELHEDRFGREQKVNKRTIEVLNTQIELIQKRLELSQTEVGLGFLRRGVSYATKISRVPLERMIPYKLQAGIAILNVIAIVVLSYLNSIQKINSELAIAIYTAILMISLEVIRLKRG